MLWKYAKRGVRVLMGRVPRGRRLNVFPDDVFLVSYPRSGNTWARFLIGNLLNPEEPVTFANIEARIPETHLFRDRVPRRRPRILRSHEYFDHRYKRVIYIVRDPRDIATSMYHYSIKRRDIADGYPIEPFVPRFVNGEFLADFGAWHEHASSWLAARQNQSGFLLLRYEEMHADPEHELTNAALLRVNVASDAIAPAVQLSSVGRMGELENRQAEAWKLTRKTRHDKPFVRAARSGSWRSELPSGSVPEIERA